MAKVFVLAFIGALAAGLGATVFFELRGAASWSSRRLIKVAVRLLPESIRDEREEEWFAEYEHWKDGAIGRLLWALGLLVAATRIGRRERQSALAQQSPQGIPGHLVIRLKDLGGFINEGLINVARKSDGQIEIHIPNRLGLDADTEASLKGEILALLKARPELLPSDEDVCL